MAKRTSRKSELSVRWRARAAIKGRRAGRWGIPLARVETRSPAWSPEQLGITLQKSIELSSELKNVYDNDGEIRELLDLALKIEGAGAQRRYARGRGRDRGTAPLTHYVPALPG